MYFRTRRHTRELRALRLKENMIKRLENYFYVLHWDGKCLKSLEHTGSKIEAIAIILTNCRTGYEELVKILKIDESCTAEVINTLLYIIYWFT